jgi:uncharacterized protein (DUF2336 family)
MNMDGSLLRDLDEAVLRGTPESRMRALWHATDLMIAGRYSDDEISTFGEVVARIADEIEVAARARLAKRLAGFHRAPRNIIHSSPSMIRSKWPAPYCSSPSGSRPES